MMATPEHIIPLIKRRLDGKPLTSEEQSQVRAWLQGHGADESFFNDSAWEQNLQEYLAVDRDDANYQQALARFRAAAGLPTSEAVPTTEQIIRPVHRVHFLKTAWLRYAAAIIILFGIGAYLWNNNKTHPKENTAAITPSSSDILPGGQKATLTLADGRTIILDSAQNGQLATENGSEIIKRGDEIIYDAGQIQSEAVVYNTMTTPKGGQYQLTLPDGSKVWLNAASKIIYPTRFIGKTREVKVEGEVYFEVKGNAKMPFIVKSGNDEVTVLGTEFNINNYADEPASKISLINGAVKVNKKLLQPGQAYSNGKIIQTNIEQDVAWRNGVFDFNGMGLKAMMSQLEKWYDITVQYKTDIRDVKFEGKLSRDLTLSQMLEILEEMDVEFTIMGRTLIVRKNQ